MKLSQKQAALLATKVKQRLEKAGVGKISPAKAEEVRKFVANRAHFVNILKRAQDNINEYDKKFVKIVGDKLSHHSRSEDAQMIINRLEKDLLPSLCTIEDEILLNSMFDKSEDLEKFLDSIVKKFSK